MYIGLRNYSEIALTTDKIAATSKLDPNYFVFVKSDYFDLMQELINAVKCKDEFSIYEKQIDPYLLSIKVANKDKSFKIKQVLIDIVNSNVCSSVVEKMVEAFSYVKRKNHSDIVKATTLAQVIEDVSTMGFYHEIENDSVFAEQMDNRNYLFDDRGLQVELEEVINDNKAVETIKVLKKINKNILENLVNFGYNTSSKKYIFNNNIKDPENPVVKLVNIDKFKIEIILYNGYYNDIKKHYIDAIVKILDIMESGYIEADKLMHILFRIIKETE